MALERRRRPGLLEAVRTTARRRASTSRRRPTCSDRSPGEDAIHDEASAFMPQSPYAAAKAAAHLLCDAYRRAFDLRVACGILSNHESRRRPASFLTAQGRDLRPLAASGRSPPAAVGSAPGGQHGRPARMGVRPGLRRRHEPDLSARSASARTCRGRPPEEDRGSNYRDYVLGIGPAACGLGADRPRLRAGGFPLDWDPRRATRPTGRPAWRTRGAWRSSWIRRSSGLRIRPRSGRIRRSP